MKQMLSRGLSAPYAWIAGWIAWFIAVTALAFALPFLSDIVASDSRAISIALIATLFVVILLGLPILWLILIAMRPSAQRALRVPLIAFALLVGVLLLAGQAPPSSVSPQSLGNPLIAFFFLVAISLFSLGTPAIALSFFLSDGMGIRQMPFVWPTIIFFCMFFVTILPIWIASLTRHGQPAQRRLVIGLFLGYWAYTVIGLVVAIALGLVALWM